MRGLTEDKNDVGAVSSNSKLCCSTTLYRRDSMGSRLKVGIRSGVVPGGHMNAVLLTPAELDLGRFPKGNVCLIWPSRKTARLDVGDFVPNPRGCRLFPCRAI